MMCCLLGSGHCANIGDMSVNMASMVSAAMELRTQQGAQDLSEIPSGVLSTTQKDTGDCRAV